MIDTQTLMQAHDKGCEGERGVVEMVEDGDVGGIMTRID